MSTTRLFTYEAVSVTVSLFGIDLVGLVADSFLTIEREEPVTTVRKAMDGSGTAFVDNHGSYRVTIRLDASSESNTILSLIYKVYLRSGYNLRMPLIVNDKNSNSVFTSLDTLFETDPVKNYANKQQTVEWVFLCESPTNTLSGYGDDEDITTNLKRILDFLDTADSVGLDLTAIQDKLSSSISSISSKLTNLV